MEEKQIHFYNVVTGSCACGAKVNKEVKSFSVFPHLVSCPACLALLKANTEKSEGKSG